MRQKYTTRQQSGHTCPETRDTWHMTRVSPGDVAAEEHDDRGDEHDCQVEVPGLLRHSHLPQLHCNQVPNIIWQRQDTSAHLLTVKSQVILQEMSSYYSKRKKITFYLSQDCFEFPDASYWAWPEGCVDLLEFWYSNRRDWWKGSILNIIKTVNQNPKLEYSIGSINVSALSTYLWKIPMSKFDNRWCTACSCGEMLAWHSTCTKEDC